MRMPRLIFLISSLLIAAPLFVFHAAERAVDWLLGFIPSLASEPRLAVDGPALSFETTGTAGDPALLNSLRHEAGMRRLN